VIYSLSSYDTSERRLMDFDDYDDDDDEEEEGN
jgi:hypothetical protein